MGKGRVRTRIRMDYGCTRAAYFERYGEESDEYVGERQVGQIVISDGPHPFAGDYGPYDQTVAGHGDYRYGSVEH